MDQEKDRAIVLLQDSGAGFERIVQRAGDAVWNRKPPGNGWSLAEVAEHVMLVERSTAKLFRKRLFIEPAAEALLAAAAGKDGQMRTYQADREDRRTAPDFVTPRGTWTGRAEVLAVFLEERAAVIAAIRTAPAALRRYAAPHPILGPLDAYQWALFLGHHLERHLVQMEETFQRVSGRRLGEPTGN